MGSKCKTHGTTNRLLYGKLWCDLCMWDEEMYVVSKGVQWVMLGNGWRELVVWTQQDITRYAWLIQQWERDNA